MQINNTYGRYLILSAYCSWLIMFPMRSFGASLELTFSDAKQLAIPQVIVALIPKLKKDYSGQRVAVMDQKNNQFIPSLLVIRVNTLVSFPNSDDVRHHVYSFSPTKRFELRLYHGKTAEPVLFDQAGRAILGCNIHDSMVANIYVAVSDNKCNLITQRVNLLAAPKTTHWEA